jgi:hypothetical protein
MLAAAVAAARPSQHDCPARQQWQRFQGQQQEPEVVRITIISSNNCSNITTIILQQAATSL